MPHLCCYPNPILKVPSAEIIKTEDYKTWIEGMMYIWSVLETPLGLAGIQVGLTKRIMIVKIAGLPEVMINPVVISKSEEQTHQREYCYSLPGISNIVPASKEITIEYQDEEFNVKENTFVDIEARIIQHELNHMEGKTILDIGRLPASFFESKLKRLGRKNKGLLYV